MKMNFTWPFMNSDKKNPGRGSLRLDRNYRDVNYRISIRVTRGIICSTALLGTPRFFALVGEYIAGQVCAAVSDRAVSLVSQPLNSKHTKPNINRGIKHGVLHDFDSSRCGLLRYKAHVTVLRVTWVVFNFFGGSFPWITSCRLQS